MTTPPDQSRPTSINQFPSTGPLHLASLLCIALAILTVLSISPVQAHHEWKTTYASSYGEASQWDSGVDGNGYFSYPLSFHWHCSIRSKNNRWPTHDWAYLRYTSRGIAHQTLPLGTYVELLLYTAEGYTKNVIAPITDRGPYTTYGDNGAFDIQETIIWDLLWEDASAWGVRKIEYRLRPDLGRYCPRHSIRLPDAFVEDMDSLAVLESTWDVLGWPK